MSHHIKLLSKIVETPKIGNTKGICRITGEESEGIPFDKWVKKTFTDYPYLQPGTIISNEALFTFNESCTILQEKVGKERPQRFRTYSHILVGDKWYALTKADKEKMFDLIMNQNPDCVCIAESGQKHIFFKVRQGWWQFEERQIQPDKKQLLFLNVIMNELYSRGFSQEEIKTGKYQDNRILKAGVARWKDLEDKLKIYRNSNIFDFAAFFMRKVEDVEKEFNTSSDEAKQIKSINESTNTQLLLF